MLARCRALRDDALVVACLAQLPEAACHLLDTHWAAGESVDAVSRARHRAALSRLGREAAGSRRRRCSSCAARTRTCRSSRLLARDAAHFATVAASRRQRRRRAGRHRRRWRYDVLLSLGGVESDEFRIAVEPATRAALLGAPPDPTEHGRRERYIAAHAPTPPPLSRGARTRPGGVAGARAVPAGAPRGRRDVADGSRARRTGARALRGRRRGVGVAEAPSPFRYASLAGDLTHAYRGRTERYAIVFEAEAETAAPDARGAFDSANMGVDSGAESARGAGRCRRRRR